MHSETTKPVPHIEHYQQTAWCSSKLAHCIGDNLPANRSTAKPRPIIWLDITTKNSTKQRQVQRNKQMKCMVVLARGLDCAVYYVPTNTV